MTDAELLRRFEEASLSGDEFTHRQHLRVAWLYLERHGRDEALERMSSGLRRLVAALGKADKFDHTLTRDWINAIHTARSSHPDVQSFDAFIAACPHLLNSSAVRGARSERADSA